MYVIFQVVFNNIFFQCLKEFIIVRLFHNGYWKLECNFSISKYVLKPFEAFKDWSFIQEKNWVWQEGRNIINYALDWPKTCQFCKYYTFIYNYIGRYINVFLPLDEWHMDGCSILNSSFWEVRGFSSIWDEIAKILNLQFLPPLDYLWRKRGRGKRGIHPPWLQTQDNVCWDGSWPVQCWL